MEGYRVVMKNRLKKIGIGIGIVVAMFASTFFIYVAIYYKATPEALSVLNQPNVSVEADDLIYIASSVRSDTALIFYPGAKVEYTAYLPILEQIVDEVGIDVVLVKMPFNMAIFDQNRALEVMHLYQDINTWYLGGHSMGGAMASSFSSNHPDDVEGLILMGSYIYGDVDPKDALTIYGSFNESVAEKIDYTENVVVIEGGNHAQFGNYGEQKGDVPATISTLKQQTVTVEAIKAFIDSR